jgi:nitrogen regulatory protein P-II 1
LKNSDKITALSNLIIHFLSKLVVMKRIEQFIPDRRLDNLIEVLKDANIGGMSHYRIEGRGKIKPEEIYVRRGTMRYKPKFNPRTKAEVVVSYKKIEADYCF